MSGEALPPTALAAAHSVVDVPNARCYAGVMSERSSRRTLTADEFLEWQLGTDLKCELVDGEPVAMTGARQRHDVIVINAIFQLRSRLRGTPCRASTSDVAVKIPNGNVRRPDVGVICTPIEDDALSTAEPTVLVEVLSPSTRAFDQARKLDDYQTLAALRHVVLIDPDHPAAIVSTRAEGDLWRATTLTRLDALIELPAIGVTLALADLYEDLTFRPRPRLILEGEE